MNIKIIGTGSSGNCFLFDKSLIIDIGLSFSKIKNKVDIKKIDHILLTHIHGDHLNQATLRKIVIKSGAKIVCGKFLEDYLLSVGFESEDIKIVKAGKVYKIGSFNISPIILYHDVENFGYRLFKNGEKHIHATDTSTLEGITAKNYNSATIECNHDINRLNELVKEAKKNKEFTHLIGAKNSHLSVQKTIQFVKENNIKKLYPVHIGESTKKEVIEVLRSIK